MPNHLNQIRSTLFTDVLLFSLWEVGFGFQLPKRLNSKYGWKSGMLVFGLAVYVGPFVSADLPSCRLRAWALYFNPILVDTWVLFCLNLVVDGCWFIPGCNSLSTSSTPHFGLVFSFQWNRGNGIMEDTH